MAGGGNDNFSAGLPLPDMVRRSW